MPYGDFYRPMMRDAAPIIQCRLCGGSASFAFEKVLLGRHRANFYRCESCKSLQSEPPYWLNEAYTAPGGNIDTGAAQRVLSCLGLSHMIMRLLGFRTVLDFGGGSGLFTRLMRDVGHDAYWYDGYTSPGYASGFAGDPAHFYDLVTAFEVVEHFPNPAEDFAALTAGKPSALLLMTELYKGQGEAWAYLAPEEGQHIFFYSPEALALVARQHDYHLIVGRGFALFMRSAPPRWMRWVIGALLRPRIVNWVKLLLIARGDAGAQRDYLILTKRISGD